MIFFFIYLFINFFFFSSLQLFHRTRWSMTLLADSLQQRDLWVSHLEWILKRINGTIELKKVLISLLFFCTFHSRIFLHTACSTRARPTCYDWEA